MSALLAHHMKIMKGASKNNQRDLNCFGAKVHDILGEFRDLGSLNFYHFFSSTFCSEYIHA